MTQESSGEMLQRLGMDGMLWSEEMHKRFPAVSQDDLLGWCANMIMAGYDEANRRARAKLLSDEMVEKALAVMRHEEDVMGGSGGAGMKAALESIAGEI